MYLVLVDPTGEWALIVVDSCKVNSSSQTAVIAKSTDLHNKSKYISVIGTSLNKPHTSKLKGDLSLCLFLWRMYSVCLIELQFNAAIYHVRNISKIFHHSACCCWQYRHVKCFRTDLGGVAEAWESTVWGRASSFIHKPDYLHKTERQPRCVFWMALLYSI